MLASVTAGFTRQGQTREYYQSSRQGGQEHSPEGGKGRLARDAVEWSASLPAPLSDSDLAAAHRVYEALRGGRAGAEGAGPLREDRVLAALVVLEALEVDPRNGLRLWPPGVPSPTAEELEVAYRRLTQRLDSASRHGNGERLRHWQMRRRELLEAHRMSDMHALAAQGSDAR